MNTNIKERPSGRWDDDVNAMEKKIKSAKIKEKKGNYEVCEAFPPPRICPRARERGLAGRWSLDIKTEDPISGERWDLNDPMTQKRVINMVKRDRQKFSCCARRALYSPPCRTSQATRRREIQRHGQKP